MFKMKVRSKRNLTILYISIVITIFGILLDGDVKEPNTIMRFVEFFAMVGVIFVISFIVSHLFSFIKNKILNIL